MDLLSGQLPCTSPSLLAETATRRRLTSDHVVLVALALELAVVSKASRLALLVTVLSRPAGRTGAVAIDGIAGGIVLALAGATTAIAIMIEITGSVALVVPPARSTEALSRLRCTLGAILAVALEGTVLAIAANGTALLALIPSEARRTEAGAIDG